MLFEGSALTVNLGADGIAEVTFDLQGESVNKFNAETVSQLTQVLDLLEVQEGLRGVLLTSGKSVFIVGADITEFLPVFAEGVAATRSFVQRNVDNINRLEDFNVPVVVAINGFALGGGLEVCLGCDGRVASSVAKVGLPETSLGIIPGWGGTVRLPRMAGCAAALEWIAGARPVSAAQAATAGVVDKVAEPDELITEAKALLEELIETPANVARRRALKTSPAEAVDASVFEQATAAAMKVSGPNYPAPLAAIRCIQHSITSERGEALRLEQETFLQLTEEDSAKALIGIFLSDQLLSKRAKQWEKQADKKVVTAAVLGAGIMGGGIAYQSALTGTPILMKDIAQPGIDLGMSEAESLLAKKVSRGRMTEAQSRETLARITPTLEYTGFESVDMVVEAVIENPKIKASVLSEVEEKISDDAIIASNTSTILISSLADTLQRPQNFCGMHFFNPVHAMPLVEVIRGEKTSDLAVARTVAYANSLGKKAIVVKDCPGFLVNRVLFPYLAGFAGLVRDGADFQHIDQVMEAWGWPMGPAYLLDVVGIDTCNHAEEVMAEGFPDRMAKASKTAADVLYENNRYGQKNGKGFYRYDADGKGRPQKAVDKDAYDLIATVSAPTRKFSDDDIIARMMIPMATEMARCLEEGIVETAGEADMSLIYGVGFPRFRGGGLRWVDSLGISAFVELCDTYKALGKLYFATDKQREMASAGKSYYG